MKVIFLYYIQEADKPSILFKLFNIVQLEGDKIILPIDGEKEMPGKKAQKMVKKTKKILAKTISKRIVMSEKIQRQEEYVNMLHILDLDIVQGRWLFEVLSCKVLDYVLEQKEWKKEEVSISILVNDLTENTVANIRQMAKEYKRVNIVTNHRERFKKIEKQILEEDGIMITVGNNKKKGISKSQMILNIDFPCELINQYRIYEEAIIVNIRGNVKINQKRFNGITINDYEITFENAEGFDYDKTTKYKACKLYEAQINKKQPFQEIMKQIEKDKVKITKLIGINTEI